MKQDKQGVPPKVLPFALSCPVRSTVAIADRGAVHAGPRSNPPTAVTATPNRPIPFVAGVAKYIGRRIALGAAAAPASRMVSDEIQRVCPCAASANFRCDVDSRPCPAKPPAARSPDTIMAPGVAGSRATTRLSIPAE